MATLYKALKRPATFLGVPMVPLFLMACTFFVLGVYTNKFAWLLIIVGYFPMRLAAARDEQIFNLFFLKLKTKGNSIANRYFKVNSTLANRYNAIHINESLKIMKLSDRKSFAEVIPFSSHISDYIVQNKEGDLIATWQVVGSQFECIDDFDLQHLDESLATFIKSCSGMAVTFYTHNSREKFYDDFSLRSENVFADMVCDKYYEGIKKNQFLKNRIHFTVVFKPYGKLQKQENRRLTLQAKKEQLEDNLRTMEEIRGRINSVLDKFTCSPLGMYEEKGVVYSAQLSFYNSLISGTKQKVRVLNTPIYNYLGSSDVFCGHDTGEIVNHKQEHKFFRSIEIKEFVDETDTGLFDALLYLNVSYVLTQSFSVMSKQEALELVKGQEKQLRSAEDDAISQRQALIDAKDEITGGDIVMGKHHMSLIVYSDSLEELRKDTNDIINIFSDLGLIATLSTLSLTAAFYSQLPSVFTLRPRLSPISNINFAHLASFHNFYQGKRDKNCWGEAITILKTPSKQPYYLNLHNSKLFKNEVGEKNLANTCVIGSAGSGKTMLLSFMQNSLQKFGNPLTFEPAVKNKNLTTVFFDKDRGAELNIRALGGQYFRVKSGEETGWNPFYLESSKRNLVFIKSLMKILVTRHGEELNTSEEIQLSQAVEAVMAMPIEYRKSGISRLIEHLPSASTLEERKNSLSLRLKQWAKGGEFGWIFDNEIDSFDLSGINNIGIDGTEFLDNKDVCSPISFYLLYRVTQLFDGRRLVIFFDEFWKWLGDAAFSDFVYNKLKTIRKLNGLVIPTTQSPDEILKNPIAAAVREQCSTQIFLPNPNAERKEYVDGFKLTEEEFKLISELDPTSRQFLIKKGELKQGDKKFSALVSLDLSGLGRLTKILSGSEDNLDIFDGIYRPGMSPSDWIYTFMEKAV